MSTVECFWCGGVTAARVPAGLPRVTDRELEVLAGVAHGLTSLEVAQKLFISEGTVKRHLYRMSERLGARTRSQLVAIAFVRGYLQLPGGA